MRTIFIKELRSFLSSFVGYIVIVVFLLVNGMFMWILPDTNIRGGEYANLDNLFFLGPWIFIVLISAFTMKTFSEEKKQGTLEILATSPISDWTIIFGKFFASCTLVIFALIPTLVYYYSVYQLGDPPGNIDSGAVWGSYFGLLLIGFTFSAIGIFASTITENQVVAFVISLFLCFFFYQIFQTIGEIPSIRGIGYYIQWLGMYLHYESVSRGVIDTRDVIYFLSVILVFLTITKTVFGSRKW
jgi:ABC-2 type transport system permease protein